MSDKPYPSRPDPSLTETTRPRRESPVNLLADVWEFVRWCAAEDYRGPMPEHVRRAQALLGCGLAHEDHKCLGRIPQGDRTSHCRCWLDLERPCCRCGMDDDGLARPCKANR